MLNEDIQRKNVLTYKRLLPQKSQNFGQNCSGLLENRLLNDYSRNFAQNYTDQVKNSLMIDKAQNFAHFCMHA